MNQTLNNEELLETIHQTIYNELSDSWNSLQKNIWNNFILTFTVQSFSTSNTNLTISDHLQNLLTVCFNLKTISFIDISSSSSTHLSAHKFSQSSSNDLINRPQSKFLR